VAQSSRTARRVRAGADHGRADGRARARASRVRVDPVRVLRAD